MCKASVYAKKTRDGKKGDQVNLSAGAHGLGTFHDSNQTPQSCAVCFRTGAKLLLAGIPETIRNYLKIGDTEPVTFIETPGSISVVNHDLVKLDNHPEMKPVPLVVFADAGIKTTAKYVPSKKVTVAEVMAGKAVDEVPVGDAPMTLLMRAAENRIAA